LNFYLYTSFSLLTHFDAWQIRVVERGNSNSNRICLMPHILVKWCDVFDRMPTTCRVFDRTYHHMWYIHFVTYAVEHAHCVDLCHEIQLFHFLSNDSFLSTGLFLCFLSIYIIINFSSFLLLLFRFQQEKLQMKTI